MYSSVIDFKIGFIVYLSVILDSFLKWYEAII